MILSHFLFALFGALLGGVLSFVWAPGFFWAALIGGALTVSALRVGWVLMKADQE